MQGSCSDSSSFGKEMGIIALYISRDCLAEPPVCLTGRSPPFFSSTIFKSPLYPSRHLIWIKLLIIASVSDCLPYSRPTRQDRALGLRTDDRETALPVRNEPVHQPLLHQRRNRHLHIIWRDLCVAPNEPFVRSQSARSFRWWGECRLSAVANCSLQEGAWG